MKNNIINLSATFSKAYITEPTRSSSFLIIKILLLKSSYLIIKRY